MDSGNRTVVFTDTGRRRLARATLAGGAAAGVAAGIAMLIASMLHSAWTGLGFWLPLQSVAGIFYGVEAFVSGAPAILSGLAAHLVVSALLGVLFASMVRPSTAGATAFAGGLLFGGVVWALMTFVVLPIFNPIMSPRVAMISGWWFFQHMIFGAFLGETPALVRGFLGREAAPEGRVAPGTGRAA